jgi:hypothetical protein
MAEFKDRIPHTRGQLTIRKQGARYQLGYVHQNLNQMALVELIAVDGEPDAWMNMVAAMAGEPRPKGPPLRIELARTSNAGAYSSKRLPWDIWLSSGEPSTRTMNSIALNGRHQLQQLGRRAWHDPAVSPPACPRYNGSIEACIADISILRSSGAMSIMVAALLIANLLTTLPAPSPGACEALPSPLRVRITIGSAE